jgi:hypothetical protein
MKFKIKNKRYCCDVKGCDNYAYAEMFRTGKHSWMYVCRKHYILKLKRCDQKLERSFRGRVPKEKGIGFCILDQKERNFRKRECSGCQIKTIK